jgi:O-methyltransferase
MTIRSSIKGSVPWFVHYAYRKIYYAPKDIPAAIGFIFHKTASPTTFRERFRLVRRFYAISYHVDCPHTEHELIVIARKILNLGNLVPGVVVEAGAFHGGSTAKLSLVAKLCDRDLHVFDSFEGMPENAEAHGKSIYGREHHFPKGSHAVGLPEVEGNVTRYGDVSRAHFHKGFFDVTMPDFHEPVAAACVNVDLVQSTKDCLRYLYPLVSRGGIIVSQDGHFPWIIELLSDDAFWQREIGISKPAMEGLGSSKFVTIHSLV